MTSLPEEKNKHNDTWTVSGADYLISILWISRSQLRYLHHRFWYVTAKVEREFHHVGQGLYHIIPDHPNAKVPPIIIGMVIYYDSVLLQSIHRQNFHLMPTNSNPINTDKCICTFARSCNVTCTSSACTLVRAWCTCSPTSNALLTSKSLSATIY